MGFAWDQLKKYPLMVNIIQTICLHRPALKDQDIADVLTYIRNSFKNKATPITATDVKNERLAIAGK